jgi:hypothetical protein
LSCGIISVVVAEDVSEEWEKDGSGIFEYKLKPFHN